MIEIKGVTTDRRWKWLVKDEDGRVYMYEGIPVKKEHTWKREKDFVVYRMVASVYPIELNSIPWDQSLHEIQHTDDGLILMPWRPSFIVDGPVMVRNNEKSSWLRRHFAGWTDKGRIQAWDRGCTSFSSAENAKTWAYYRLPTPEELNRNANHK